MTAGTLPVSQNAFVDLISRIVADQFPDEQLAYGASREYLVTKLFSDGNIETAANAGRGEFQFTAESQQVLDFIKLMLGTYAVVKQIGRLVSASKRPVITPVELSRQWERQLMDSGLDRATADRIVQKFLNDLGDILGGERDVER